jgi:ribosomal protein S18 acetylase RimI-like enzyme
MCVLKNSLVLILESGKLQLHSNCCILISSVLAHLGPYETAFTPGSFDFGGSTMSYQIHEMTIQDYDDVSALWRASEGIELSSVDSRESILRFLERNPGLSFVIRDGTQLIGAVLCGHDGRRGYIDHLAVHKDYRRHGLGRSLVGRCLHALMRIGIRKHQLFILDDNKEAIEFWKNIGWAKQVELVTMSHLTGNDS